MTNLTDLLAALDAITHSVTQVAEILEIAPNDVKGMIASNELGAHLFKGALLVPDADLERWMAGHAREDVRAVLVDDDAPPLVVPGMGGMRRGGG